MQPAHIVCREREILNIENLANVDLIPRHDFWFVGLAASHLMRLPAGRKKTSHLRFVGAEGADSEDVGGVREDPAASLEEIAMKASEKDGARKMQLA